MVVGRAMPVPYLNVDKVSGSTRSGTEGVVTAVKEPKVSVKALPLLVMLIVNCKSYPQAGFYTMVGIVHYA